jgi:hypothetical protein
MWLNPSFPLTVQRPQSLDIITALLKDCHFLDGLGDSTNGEFTSVREEDIPLVQMPGILLPAPPHLSISTSAVQGMTIGLLLCALVYTLFGDRVLSHLPLRSNYHPPSHARILAESERFACCWNIPSA